MKTISRHPVKTAAMILGAVLLIVTVLHTMWQSATLVAKESSQRALVAEARSLLEDYRSRNGKYPENLVALPVTSPDGGSAELLKDMTYVCFGTAYTLRTVGYASGELIEINNKAEQSAAPLPPTARPGPSKGTLTSETKGMWALPRGGVTKEEWPRERPVTPAPR